MLVITNIENGNFSADLTSVILRDATIQNKFITNILQTAENMACETFISISKV